MLLLDNAPSHPNEQELIGDEGFIRVLYMPPNVTSLIQPMDQNIIRVTKLFYKNALASKMASSDEDVATILKNMTLKDTAFLLANSWKKIDSVLIKNCWKQILSSEEEDEDFDVPLSLLAEKLKETARLENHEPEILNTIRALNDITSNKVNIHFT